MRLFIAIQAPPDVERELKDWQQKLAGAPGAGRPKLSWDAKEGRLVMPAPAWRPSGPDQLHLTLQFLGDGLTLHQREEVREKLRKVAGRHSPFALEPTRLGAFPSAERARVLWAGVEGEGLAELAQDIEHALAPLGLRRDKPFAAHITLARSNAPQNAQALAGRPWSQKAWTADEFVLFESKVVLGGHEHQAVERYRLG